MTRAARLVRPVWSRLAELELAGHDPGVLAALRYALARHQPTRCGNVPSLPVAGAARRIVAAPLAVRHLDTGRLRTARRPGRSPVTAPLTGNTAEP